jgi:hypothetical protein
MNQPKGLPDKSISDWLGAGVLVLLVAGLVYLTVGGRPAAEPEEVLPQPSSTVDLSSPLADGLSSPLPFALDSPLPLEPPSSTALPTLPPVPPLSFRLTVLHSNDTWGYLMPCG